MGIVDISDHLLVFSILPNNLIKSKIKKSQQKNFFSQENLAKFKRELKLHNWSILNTVLDVDCVFTKFYICDIQCLYDNYFPFQVKTITAAEVDKPWITKAVKKSITKKHKLYTNYQMLRTQEALSKYKTYQNKLT